jgi:hypothetical protein
LRGDKIELMREQSFDARARRLQAGHELGDEHEKYGRKALTAVQTKKLAHSKLSKEIDWSVFRGLDFDKLAVARRTRGRKPSRPASSA